MLIQVQVAKLSEIDSLFYYGTCIFYLVNIEICQDEEKVLIAVLGWVHVLTLSVGMPSVYG